jgi:hypothetical protein
MSNKNLKSKFNSRITNSKTLANYEVNPCTFSPLLNDEKLQKVKVKEHRVLPNFNKKGPHEAGINLLN